MNSNIIIACRWLHQLCLSVWIGGIVLIGAVVAPVAFKHSGLDTAQAGNVVGGSLDRFNLLCYLTGVVLLLVQAVEWQALKPAFSTRKPAAWRLALTAAMLGLAVYLGMGLAPKMVKERAAGQMEAFRAGHQRYEQLSQVQFGLAVGVAFLTAMLSVRSAKAEGSPAPPEREAAGVS